MELCQSIKLTRYLETRSESRIKPEANVVEMGAGTGLCGIAAACLGANVPLTDKRGMTDLLSDNIVANEVAISAAGGSASATALSWGQPMHPTYKIHFDVVLASDNVYHLADAENLDCVALVRSVVH